MAWAPLKSSPSRHPFLFLHHQPSPLGGSPRGGLPHTLVSETHDGGCAPKGLSMRPHGRGSVAVLVVQPPTVTMPDSLSTYYVLGAKNGAVMKKLLVLAQRRHILVLLPDLPTDAQTLPLCFFRPLLQCHCFCEAKFLTKFPSVLPAYFVFVCLTHQNAPPGKGSQRLSALFSALSPHLLQPGTKEICADYRGVI